MIEGIVKTLEQKLSFITNGGVRVRFAPSPTGFFHIGSARTALFNYLFAKKNKGMFILRIEDTDKERSKLEYEEDIIENLKWLGIEWDEGPYKQSKRKEIYKEYIKKLLQEEKAYYCFCTAEELEAKKQEQMSRGLPSMYDGKCAKLSKKEVEDKIKEGEQSIIRFKVPHKKVVFDDIIRGKIEFDTSLIGDFTIAKDLDYSLYNFAVVIDDFEMKITHVIRGEDLMPNTPKQILMQEALGFSSVKYGHLPLILGSDRSKLSKRHGATSLREYRDLGYLPETLINFLAFLGWNPGTEREIFSFNSLQKEFSMDSVQKSGAIFNQQRLDYLNGFYIRHTSLEKITGLCIPYLVKKGLIIPILRSEQYPPAYGGIRISQDYMISETKEKIDFIWLKRIVEIYQERLKKLSEISDLTDYFFKDKLNYSKDLLKWKDMTSGEVKASLDKAIDILFKIDKWNQGNLEKYLTSEVDLSAGKAGDRGKLLWPLRVALSGKKASAGPFEIGEILGKDKTIQRLKQAKQILNEN